MSEHRDPPADDRSPPEPAAPAEGNGMLPGAFHEDQIYVPAPNERQMTPRALITGCLIGCVVGAMNISLGLKIGWSFGGSIIAAILSFSVWAVLHQAFKARRFGVLETNIAQTAGSAAGAMASAGGLLAPIPALAMLDGEHAVHLSYVELTCWTLAVGYLGVFFAVPLRNQMVVVEKLRFPSGTATAQTIVSIFAEGAEAVRKAKALLIFAVVALAVVALKTNWHDAYAAIAGYFNSPLSMITQGRAYDLLIEDPTIPGLVLFVALLIKWGFYPIAAPAMTGAGLVVGPRIGISIFAGALVGWGLLGPYVMNGGGVLGSIFGTHDGWTSEK